VINNCQEKGKNKKKKISIHLIPSLQIEENKITFNLSMVAHTCNPRLGRHKQEEEDQEFKASLGYIVRLSQSNNKKCENGIFSVRHGS
jgi:hypothetical protein